MRCSHIVTPLRSGIESLPVKAGGTVHFETEVRIGHPGPLLAYMAKVPSGSKLETWDGSGKVVSSSFRLPSEISTAQPAVLHKTRMRAVYQG